MSALHKRASPPENGEHSQSGKKPRADGVVKQEQEEGGKASQDSEGEGAVVEVEAMEEPQIILKMAVSLFHCQSCLRPLKPPTFKCEAGHVVCCTCRGSHTQFCSRAAAYATCGEVDVFVRVAKVPCAYDEFGCTSFVVYYESGDHHRSCRFAPCSCPGPSCEFITSPARLVGHYANEHGWPVTMVSYGKPYKIAVPPPQGWHVLVGEVDRCVFLVSASAIGAAMAVSLVCVRANGDAAMGAPQFKCKLWVDGEGSKENMAMMMFRVGSSNLAGGFSAGDQGMFLAVPPELLQDESGETPVLLVRIDKVDATATRSATPPARCSRRLQ